MVTSLRSAFGLAILSSVPEDRKSPTSPKVATDQIEACRRGDRSALDAVFRAHAESIARLLTRIVGPTIEVEDLLQDTFAEAIGAFRSFRGEASVKTWLHRIAIHVAHQHLRRPRNRREVVVADTPEVVSDPVSPEQREVTRRLYEHLDSLDATKRVALVLYAIEGHTVDEIAVLMRASKTATRSRIFWARRTLLRQMARDPRFVARGAK